MSHLKRSHQDSALPSGPKEKAGQTFYLTLRSIRTLPHHLNVSPLIEHRVAEKLRKKMGKYKEGQTITMHFTPLAVS